MKFWKTNLKLMLVLKECYQVTLSQYWQRYNFTIVRITHYMHQIACIHSGICQQTVIHLKRIGRFTTYSGTYIRQ